jgi:hypothetical protein
LSISGNDSGQHHPQDHTSHSTPRDHLGGFFADADAREGLTGPFMNFMRTRRPRTRCQLSVLGSPTTLTSSSTGSGQADPPAEQACWKQLRAAIRTASDGHTATAGDMLPAEIAAAEWEHDGHRVRIRRTGATVRTLRCAQRGIRALTPLPLVGALSQPFVGGATAAGIFLAPLPLTAPNDPPPYSMALPGRTLHGEIDRPEPRTIAGTHPTTPVVRPGAPLFPALPTPSPLIPQQGDSAEQDAAPTPVPAPTYRPAPSAQRTAPATPAPSSTPTADPTPTPSPTGLLNETSPTPTPSGTPTAKPTVLPSPVVTRTLKHRHWQHHGNLLRRGHRAR